MAQDELSLAAEAPLDGAQAPLTAVQLTTRRDHSLLVTALVHRLEGLDKLAQKCDNETYPALGRRVKADAAQIRENILPQFASQQELPLGQPGDLIAAVKTLISPCFNLPHGEPGKGDARDCAIVDALLPRLCRALQAAAERGFWAGEASRENDAIVIALRAVSTAQGDAA